MTRADAIVIGAGHNGLACACYLARAGLSVRVLEHDRAIGGMTRTEEVTRPGYWSDLHATGWQLANLSPAPHELELSRHGLSLIEPEFSYAHAFPDGRSITVRRDAAYTHESIARICRKDSVSWDGLLERYLEGRQRICAGLFSPPPALAEESARWARDPEAWRFSLQSVRSFAHEQFASDEVRALLGAFAVFVGAAPDDAGGAEIAWLFACVLQTEGNKLVRGGMQQLAQALFADLHEHGGVVRTRASVDRILVENGTAIGVRLVNGEVIEAGRVVVSAVDPAQLGKRLLDTADIGEKISEELGRYEWGDAAFEIFVALDGAVGFRAGDDLSRAAHVHLAAPSLDVYVSAAARCREGVLPASPLVVCWNESAIDPTRAPQGKHLKKFVVLGVPWDIREDETGHVSGRTWEDARDAYADYLLDQITDDYMPDLKRHILARTAHSPVDLASRNPSVVRGTLCQGAMLPYQMGAVRPVAGLHGYRTPVKNVFIASSGAHPGPGVSMAAGRNAAQVILASLGIPFPFPLT